MAVEVFTPEIQVILIKTTGIANGSAYRNAAASINGSDITMLLGDSGTVRTTKGLDGQSGGFSITFPDGVEDQVADTAYAIIEPMDMIEIRMSRIARLAFGAGNLPLVMRGFVSVVKRVETIEQDGSPNRVVVVQGQDECKIWWNHGILPEQVFVDTGSYLDRFRLHAATTIPAEYMPVDQFMNELIEVVNEKVAEMNSFAGTAVPLFRRGGSVPDGMVAPQLVAPFKGPFWQLAELVADRPWNELFVESAEDGPILHFRPAPYRHLIGGGLIMPGAVMPPIFERDVGHVITWDAQRTDARVANFFWVPPGQSMLHTAAGTNTAILQLSAVETFGYPNSARAIFGARKMEAQTRLMPNDLFIPPNRMAPGERMGGIEMANSWHRVRAEQLRDMNQDNAAFEELTLNMQGHEELRPGHYLRITRGQIPNQGLVTEGYITKVAHTFSPFRSFTTQVSVERSDGFVNRDAMASSPMWAEGRRGPYSPE